MAKNVQNNDKDIDGRVVYISEPQYINERYTKRILVIEVFVGERRGECPIVFSNARMKCLDGIKVGDWCNVQFHIWGNKAKGDGEPRWFGEFQGYNCIKG